MNLDEGHLCARSHSDGFSLPGASKHYPPDLGLEPVHSDIALRVDVVGASIEGAVTHTVVARRPEARELRLDAVALEDVAVDDPDGRPLAWSYDGEAISLMWQDPLAVGDTRRVRVRYRLGEPAAGLYFSRPSEAYPDTPYYAATDHETERARHWLPCVDAPAVRPRLDFHLTAESRFTILANGELMGEEPAHEGFKTAHWRLDFPCPSYLTCFVIGDLVRADDQPVSGIPIAYFTTRDHPPEDLMRAFGRTPAMMGWLPALLDRPFPFPKYYQFALPGFIGAMENISLTSWNDLYVVDAVLSTEIGELVDAVNIHEMAHSYFGDAIVVRDYAHAWLKESWATYIEQVWWEQSAGIDATMYTYYANATAYFDEADKSYMRPIVTRKFASSWEMYDRHLYPGGACRLHTLRHLLGDEVFWAAVRDYVKRYEGGIVETEDFRRVMEQHSGRELVGFFDQWFYSKGYPALKVTFAHNAAKSEGMFTVEQTQVDEKKDVGLFVFDLDLAWLIDGVDHVRTVKIHDAKHTLVVPMAGDPSAVRVDPGAKVLHKLDFNPGAARLSRQLTEAPDLIGRILAGRELVKAGGGRNIASVADAYRGEPFWGVRVRWAQALGDANTHAAAGVLAGFVASESDPRALRHVIQAAGRYRDAGVREAILTRLGSGLPYLAERAALEALGGQRDAAPYAVLAAAAARPGWAGLAQSGAFAALAATRRDEAVDTLVAAARYGATSNRARPAALTALGEIGRVLDRRPRERVREALLDGLRDPHRDVRVAALSGLRLLGDPSVIGALQEFRAGLSRQEQVHVDHAIASVRAAATPAGRAAEKDLEELRAELKKLRESVDSLQARADPAPSESPATKPKSAKAKGKSRAK